MIRRTIFCIALVVLGAGCGEKSEPPPPATKPASAKVKCVKFRSKIGTSMVCPEDWSAVEEGQNWTITSVDEQAGINVYTCLAEGSGTLEDFRKLVADSLGENVAGLSASDWAEVSNNNWKGYSRSYSPGPKEATECWDLLVMKSGAYYYAIRIRTSALARKLNGEFYNNIAKSFTGIEQNHANKKMQDKP